MDFLTPKPRGGRALALLSGIGIGAAVMYVLDPQGGRGRRAVARDKAVSLANKTGKVVGARSRDLGNRAKGVAAEVRSALGKSGEQDDGAQGRPGRPQSDDSREKNRGSEFEEDGGL